MKSSCFKAILVPLLAMCMLLSGAAWASPGSAPAGYEVSAQTWAENYFEYFSENNLEVSTQMYVPQVWLFSPQGDMVRLASKNTDPQLQKLSAAFPDAVGAEALPGQPTSTQARAFLAQTLSDQSVPAPRQGHWYAVLILKERPAPHGCKGCAAYDKTLRAMQMNHPDMLDTVRVTLVLSR